MDELKDATYILRPGKACGIDSISNEMLRCVVEYKPEVILDLLNSTLNGTTPDEYRSILTPIHKRP